MTYSSRALLLRMMWPLAIVAAWAVVLTLRSIDVFAQWSPLHKQTIEYVALWLVIYLSALCVPLLMRRSWPGLGRLRMAESDIDKWVHVFAVAGLAGAALVAYEYLVRRGYALSMPVTDIRIEDVNRATRGFTGSWVSGAGRFLTSALIVGWILAAGNWQRVGIAAKTSLLIATVVVFLEQAKFEGGRLYAVCILAMTCIAYVLLLTRNAWRFGLLSSEMLRRSNPAFLAYLILSFVLLQYYVGYVFQSRADNAFATQAASQVVDDYLSSFEVQRTQQPVGPAATAPTGNDTQVAVRSQLSGPPSEDKAQVTPPNSASLVQAQTPPEPKGSLASLRQTELSPMMFKLAMTWIYVTGGLNEFDRVLAKRPFVHGNSFYMFPQLAQIASKITGTDLRYNVSRHLPVVGTYTTLVGSAYIDFGWTGGLIFACSLGLLTGILIRLALDEPTAILALLAPIFLVIGLFGPVTAVFANLWPAMVWIGLIAAAKALSIRQSHAELGPKWSCRRFQALPRHRGNRARRLPAA